MWVSAMAEKVWKVPAEGKPEEELAPEDFVREIGCLLPLLKWELRIRAFLRRLPIPAI